jgi:vitamin B12 transporter
MWIKNSTRKASGVGAAVCAVLGGVCVPSAWATPALNEVVVTASRQPERLSAALADVTVISREDIDRSGASTLEDLLARQAGVGYAANGGVGATSGVFVRGTNSRHVLLLVDGVRVGSVSAGSPNWSRLPLAQIDRIEVVRGPLSSLYGSDAIGGVVQVFTRRPDQALNFDAEWGVGTRGTHRGHVSTSGVQGRFQYALTSSYERTRGIDFTSSTTDGDDRDGFEQGAIHAHLGYQVSADHALQLSALFGRGDNEYDGSSLADVSSRTNTSSTSVTWSAQWTSRWRSELQLGQGVDDAEERQDGEPQSRLRSTQRQLSWQHNVGSDLGNWTLGVERLEQRLNATAVQEKERNNNALFAGWRWSPGPHTIQLNGRRDRNSQYGGQSTGSVAYGYRWSENWRGSVSYGTAFKAPTFGDLYSPYGGNPGLNPEQARQREVALHYGLDRHQVSLRWYLSHVYNLIDWVPSSGGAWAPSNVNRARQEGWSLTYTINAAGLDWSAQFDQLSALDRSTNKMLLRRARHAGVLSVSRQSDGWDWRLEWRAQGARADIGGERLGGYAVLNAYLSKQLATQGWSVFAKADNVFDRSYELAKGYRTPGLSALVGVRYTMP